MLYLMLVFSVLGGIDKLLNNKHGLGVKFEEGFKAMGGLALTIIGIYSFSPLIAKFLLPILLPLSKLLNVDPSVFLSSILATDLGAYTTSVEMAHFNVMAEYNSLILGSMLGATISFTIPIAISLIPNKDTPLFAKGILAGIVTIPIGMIVSGLIIGIPFSQIMINLFPIIIFVIIIFVTMIKAQEKLIQVFSIFGKAILTISTIGLIISILNFTLGVELIEDMLPLEEGAIVVINISIVLSGAYPMLYFVSRKGHRVFRKITEKYELDEYSVLGLVSSLASCIPMFGVFENMNDKGKVLNSAFAVSGAFTLGGQLGYVTSVAPEYVDAFIIGKLVAGVLAVGLSVIMMRTEDKRNILQPITNME